MIFHIFERKRMKAANTADDCKKSAGNEYAIQNKSGLIILRNRLHIFAFHYIEIK